MQTKKVIVITLFAVIAGCAIWFYNTDPAQEFSQTVLVPSKTNSERESNAPERKVSPISHTKRKIAPKQSVDSENSQSFAGPYYYVSSADDYQSKYGELPFSIDDLNIKWDITADADGKLIVTRDLSSMFEFFLSVMSAEGIDTAVGRIEEYLGLALPEDAAQEALKIFNGYLEYKQNLNGFAFSQDRIFTGDETADLIATISDVKAELKDRIEQRRKYLGREVANIFFKDDEAYDLYTIRRLEIETDNSIGEAEKENEIIQAAQQLPEYIKNKVLHQRKEAALKKQIEKLRAQGGNENAIYDLRAEFYGEKEADIMAMEDKAEIEWMDRVRNYHRAKDNILVLEDLTDIAKEERIKEIENDMFNETELMEIKIMERAAAQKKKKALSS